MNLKIFKYTCSVIAVTSLLFLAGCGIYSFTGVAIKAETITIRDFYNDAEGGPPDLSQTFGNKLRDYYLQNTNLALVIDEGELILEGAITGYRISQVAPTSTQSDQFGDASALTRLTITVKASYVNTTDDTFDFEDKTFSFYSDFDNSQNLTAVENQLIEEIYDQIILDIFNASVANW